MFRNREIQLLLLAMGTISLIAAAAAAFIAWSAAVLVLLTAVLLIGCSLLFTRWRYREIAQLSRYLRKISTGAYSLDVRDNQEGELSILKNDIYKVTLMLSEQNSLWQQEKLRLSDVIADISHQLKTPLTSMLVMADLLSDSKLPEKKRAEFTHKTCLQLERMDWLVSSLLKLSKIDAGTAVFQRDLVRVKELLEKAIEPLLIPMEIKEQSIKVTGEEGISFIGDIQWTREALINILKNCVEHTPAGGSIWVSFTENALFTEIVIADNGPGIPKEDLPYIFKRFYKGKNAGEDSVGIGLAMAHSIISSQNGIIEVKSQEDEGTEFTIKFYKQIL
ncbi:MAG: HAMP domain-containing histidine kinase [Syntrophomonadaceae bacterium]|jgi:signal transduction histidine kinase|nr:HAMP domain-containing histidine kinase [Syntrophomonadaceae bacterium]